MSQHAHDGDTHSSHEHGDHGHSGHEHGANTPLSFIRSLLQPHSHEAADKVDPELESDARGVRALKISLIALAATALFQLVIVYFSASVALLNDTIHNLADAFTALPLWVAFTVGRRASSRRYTYGFGRAEDLAGVLIVIVIALSTFVALAASIGRFFNPEEMTHIPWVLAAGVVGFIGNEGVAILRIKVGKEIGSAALVADGYHARADGFTSLGVVLAALGALAGFPLADPIVGVLISVALIAVLRGAAKDVWHRLMDAVEPSLIGRLERTAGDQRGVQGVDNVRARWIGHRLEAELHITVDGSLSTDQSHAIAEVVRHALLHAEGRLAAVAVHVDPSEASGVDAHSVTRHHAVRLRRPQGRDTEALKAGKGGI